MAGVSPDFFSSEFPDENHSFLDMELEALQSIYINELEVKIDDEYTTVAIDLYPSTADKLDEKYVRMTLMFILEEEYPEKIPEIKIRNPRGLSDDKLDSIIQDLIAIAESKKGNSMLFEMIDAAKEHLTVGNRPSGECAICLHRFSEKDAFTKTECYHYFHSHCLARYAKNFSENCKDNETNGQNYSRSGDLLCPMCRISIQFDDYDVDYPPPEESYESNFTLTEEIVKLQKKMSYLFQKQVEKGGIIDVEAEKNKFLLEISNVPTRVVSNEENPEHKISNDADSDSDSDTEHVDDVESPINERKYVKDPKKFDYHGKNKNFNRLNENRTNHKQDFRYNRQSYDNYRGGYNKCRYGKLRDYSNGYRNYSNASHERSEHSSATQNSLKIEDVINSQNVPDNNQPYNYYGGYNKSRYCKQRGYSDRYQNYFNVSHERSECSTQQGSSRIENQDELGNKHSYNYRSGYNKSRYGKQRGYFDRYRNDSNASHKRTEDSLQQDSCKTEAIINSRGSKQIYNYRSHKKDIYSKQRRYSGKYRDDSSANNERAEDLAQKLCKIEDIDSQDVLNSKLTNNYCSTHNKDRYDKQRKFSANHRKDSGVSEKKAEDSLVQDSHKTEDEIDSWDVQFIKQTYDCRGGYNIDRCGKQREYSDRYSTDYSASHERAEDLDQELCATEGVIDSWDVHDSKQTYNYHCVNNKDKHDKQREFYDRYRDSTSASHERLEDSLAPQDAFKAEVIIDSQDVLESKQKYNYHGGCKKDRYDRQSGYSDKCRDDPSAIQEKTEDSLAPQGTSKTEDTDSQDSVLETSDHSSPYSKAKYKSNVPTGCNSSRSYRHGECNYSNYYNNNRQFDKSRYHERCSSQTSRKYSTLHNEEAPLYLSDAKVEDVGYRTCDNTICKMGDKPGSLKNNYDYSIRNRYSDQRNNSQQAFKGAYCKKNNYSNLQNNYSQNSRYGDSREKEHYSDNYSRSERYDGSRNRNQYDKATYGRNYKAISQSALENCKEGTKNAGSKPVRYRSKAESHNNVAESTEWGDQNRSCDYKSLKNDIVDSSFHTNSSKKEDASLHEKVEVNAHEMCSDLLPVAVDCSASNTFPNIVSENLHVIPRTVNPPPGFANPHKKVIYGLKGANPPPGFNRS